MIKFCFIDIETTGLDARKNGIIQIAGEIVYLIDIGSIQVPGVLQLQDTFNFSVKPFVIDIIEEEALKANMTTVEEIATFKEPGEIYKQFLQIVNKNCNKYNKQDKMFFVGYNARFDYDFMREWFKKNHNDYFGSYFFFPPIDVMNIAIFNCIKERHLLENFKLITIAEHLGVKVESKFHDALKDIMVTKEIFFKYLLNE